MHSFLFRHCISVGCRRESVVICLNPENITSKLTWLQGEYVDRDIGFGKKKY